MKTIATQITNHNVGDQGDGIDLNQSENRAISERKVEANRRNASKSTGPRTTRGKRHSRRNAIKHGLCVEHLETFPAKEKAEELRGLYTRLVNELHPVGFLEESAVERIAVCQWRLKRAWQFENAAICGNEQPALERVDQVAKGAVRISQGNGEVMSLLRSAQSQIQQDGKLSHELKEKLFAADQFFRKVWPAFQEYAEQRAAETDNALAKRMARDSGVTSSASKMLLASDPASQQERRRFLALTEVECAIETFERLPRMIEEHVARSFAPQLGQQSIPDEEALDKLIRYERAIERSLSRALEQLERLQKNRRGDVIRPYTGP